MDRVFPHQVGGHHVMFRHSTWPDYIIKPSLPKEIAFYEKAQVIPVLRDLLPEYRGTVHCATYGECIVLKDLTYSMVRPCVLDIKIGRRLFDMDATPEKRERMASKAQTTISGTLGFRFCGMLTCGKTEDKRTLLSKQDVCTLDADSVLPMLHTFLKPSADPTLLATRFKERIRAIRDTIAAANTIMYSSSVLFVYDAADTERWDCRLIDFAHSYVVQGRAVVDSNYVDGLSSLLGYFEAL